MKDPIQYSLILMILLWFVPSAIAESDRDAIESAITDEQVRNAQKELDDIAEEKRKMIEKEKNSALSGEELILDLPEEPVSGEGTAARPDNPRYDRAKTVFDDEYERGDITKTEYIQRKRLLDEEEK